MKRLPFLLLLVVITLSLSSCRNPARCVKCGRSVWDDCPICGSPVCSNCYDDGVENILESYVDYDYVNEWASAHGYDLIKR